MSVPLTALPHFSAEAYLAMERTSPVKHEYLAGETFTMPCTSDGHNIIPLNVAFILREHMGDTPCRLFISGVKLKLAAICADIAKLYGNAGLRRDDPVTIGGTGSDHRTDLRIGVGLKPTPS